MTEAPDPTDTLGWPFSVTCSRCRDTKQFSSLEGLHAAMMYYYEMPGKFVTCPDCSEAVYAKRLPHLEAATEACLNDIREHHQRLDEAANQNVVRLHDPKDVH